MASVIVTGYGNMLTDKDLSTPGFAMEKKRHNTVIRASGGMEGGD